MREFKVTVTVRSNDLMAVSSVKRVINEGLTGRIMDYDLEVTETYGAGVTEGYEKRKVEEIDAVSGYPKSVINRAYGKLGQRAKAVHQPTVTYFSKQYLLPQDAKNSTTGGVYIQVACVEVDGERFYYVTEFDVSGVPLQ